MKLKTIIAAFATATACVFSAFADNAWFNANFDTSWATGSETWKTAATGGAWDAAQTAATDAQWLGAPSNYLHIAFTDTLNGSNLTFNAGTGIQPGGTEADNVLIKTEVGYSAYDMDDALPAIPDDAKAGIIFVATNDESTAGTFRVIAYDSEGATNYWADTTFEATVGADNFVKRYSEVTVNPSSSDGLWEVSYKIGTETYSAQVKQNAQKLAVGYVSFTGRGPGYVSLLKSTYVDRHFAITIDADSLAETNLTATVVTIDGEPASSPYSATNGAEVVIAFQTVGNWRFKDGSKTCNKTYKMGKADLTIDKTSDVPENEPSTSTISIYSYDDSETLVSSYTGTIDDPWAERSATALWATNNASTGMLFAFWTAKVADPDEGEYPEDFKVELTTVYPDVSTNYYAYYTNIQYAVTSNLNGGEGEVTVGVWNTEASDYVPYYEHDAGESQSGQISGTPTKTGAIFQGWTCNNKDVEDTITLSSEGVYDFTIPAGMTGNLVFTANWEEEPEETGFGIIIVNAETGNVTTNFYDTLQLAINDAEDGQTVTIFEDFALDTTGVTVADKTVTIDFNSKTMTVQYTTTKGVNFVAPIKVATGGVLTITGNGTITGWTGDAAAALDTHQIIRVDGGTLKYLNGTLTAGGVDDCGLYGVSIFNGGTATFGVLNGTGPSISSWFGAIGGNNTMAPVTVTVNSGTYTQRWDGSATQYAYLCAALYAPAKGTYTINGGTFSGQCYSIVSRYDNIAQTMVINTDIAQAVFIDNQTATTGLGTRTITKGTNNTVALAGTDYAWIDGTTAGLKTSAVAKIGEAYYSTLAGAVAVAADNATVTLLKDTALTSAINIANKAITLDGAFTVSAPSSRAFGIFHGGALTIAAGTTVDGSYVKNGTIYLFPYAADATPAAGQSAKAKVVVNGTVKYTGNGGWAAILNSGNDKLADSEGTEIVINGTVSNSKDAAFYLPGKGTCTINAGASVTGTDYAAIQMKSGTLTINGGSIYCTGADKTPTSLYNNGANASGCAIQLEGNGSYWGQMTLIVNGGTITAENGKAIYGYGDDTKIASISLAGGSFSCGNANALFQFDTARKIIPGSSTATFDRDVSDFCADGYYTKKDGDVWKVAAKTGFGVIIAGVTNYYDTLQLALDAAEDGQTVAIFNACALPGRVNVNGTTPRAITIDFCGNTVTAANNDGGCGIMIRAGATVTMKNGTFDDENTNVSIWNAGTLTIASDFTVDALTTGICTFAGTLDVYGTVKSANDFALGGHGNDSTTGATITINAGALVESTSNLGIYMPGKGTLTVNAATVKGATAIWIKSGTAAVLTGANLIATGAQVPYEHGTSGADPTGDALVVENCNYPGGAPTVTISGGTFTSENGYAVASYAQTGYTALTGFVSGGTFVVDENMAVNNKTVLADGFHLGTYQDGKYVVKAGYWEGSGSAADPYQIASVEDLTALKNHLATFSASNFIQTADIDMASVTEGWEGIGTYANVTPGADTSAADTGAFKGVYDGNNKRIYNVTFKANRTYGGFFNQVTDATIKNLTIELAGTGITKVSGVSKYGFGGLIGYGYYKVAVSNVTTKGVLGAADDVLPHQSAGFAVDFAGPDSYIVDCTNEVSVFCNKDKMAGFVAFNGYDGTDKKGHDVTLTRCVNKGTITVCAGGEDGKQGVGQLFGWSKDSVIFVDCVCDGSIVDNTGTDNALIGSLIGNAGQANTVHYLTVSGTTTVPADQLAVECIASCKEFSGGTATALPDATGIFFATVSGSVATLCEAETNTVNTYKVMAPRATVDLALPGAFITLDETLATATVTQSVGDEYEVVKSGNTYSVARKTVTVTVTPDANATYAAVTNDAAVAFSADVATVYTNAVLTFTVTPADNYEYATAPDGWTLSEGVITKDVTASAANTAVTIPAPSSKAKPLPPGSFQPEPYADEKDATAKAQEINDNKSSYIAPPADVADTNAYISLFAAKSTYDSSKGQYVVSIDLTDAAKSNLQTQVNEDVTSETTSEALVDPTQTTATTTTTPGLYYWVEGGNSVNAITTAGEKELATSMSTTLKKPVLTDTTKGFYQIKVDFK